MTKKVAVALVLLAACSTGENIIQPSPAPDLPTTGPRLTSAVPAPSTTTEPEPTTTEASTTTTTRVRPATTTSLLVQTTTPQPLDYSSLPYNGWAIPEYIVACETGGSFSWTAYNRSSGASGPYQIMPEWFGGELAMNQSRAAQHTMAAELWNGGKGKSHWAACL